MNSFKLFMESLITEGKYAKWTDVNGKPLPMKHDKLLDFLTPDPMIRRTPDGEEYHLPFIPTDGLLAKSDIALMTSNLFYNYLSPNQRDQVNRFWLDKWGATFEVDFPE